MNGIYTILLLVLSNIFMTLAWYGHLKLQQTGVSSNWPLIGVIAFSWAIAFFEYCCQVPANRIGFIDNGHLKKHKGFVDNKGRIVQIAETKFFWEVFIMLTLEMIQDAQAALRGIARRTPLDPASKIADNLYIKAENLQLTGAFKIRGAYNKIRSLTPGEAAKGVIACSAGNHAQGIALSATQLGIIDRRFLGPAKNRRTVHRLFCRAYSLSAAAFGRRTARFLPGRPRCFWPKQC